MEARQRERHEISRRGRQHAGHRRAFVPVLYGDLNHQSEGVTAAFDIRLWSVYGVVIAALG